MSEIVICVAQAQHLSQVADLESMLNPYSPWNLSMLTDSVSSGASVDVLLSANRVLGYLVFDQLFEVSQILALGVDVACQRQGLARRLLEEYLCSRRNTQTTEVVLEVAASNDPAIALYESLGFEQVGLRQGYYRDPISLKSSDALILKCSL